MSEHVDEQPAIEESTKFRWQKHRTQLKILLLLSVSIVLVCLSYFFGQNRAVDVQLKLRAELEDSITENRSLRTQMAEIQIHTNKLEQKYAEDAPHGATQQIMALVKERLEYGVSPDRIAFLVAMAKNDSNCTQDTDTRRFLLQTPLTTGENAAVSFSNDTITVTGWGLPSRDTNNNLQAWFDPTEQVTIVFTIIGGEEYQTDGKLPLHYSLATGQSEHRFTIKAGEPRGFVMATEQRCDFP